MTGIKSWWQYATPAVRGVMTFNALVYVGSAVFWIGALRNWWW
jgi:hypothetical protein